MVRYCLLDIEVMFKKGLIYTLLLSTLLIPCYLLVIWTQLAFFGEVNLYFSLITLILLVFVGFLFPKLRFRTEEVFERALFKKRQNYRETLLRSSRDMVSIVDLQTITNNTVQTVGEALGIEKASLFLSDEIKGSFGLKASIGLDLDQFEEFVLLRDDPLVSKLMENPEALVREKIEMDQNGQQGKVELTQRMGELEAEVTLPLISKEKLVGMLNLGHKEKKRMYSREDLEVLSMLANQAAIAIENARLYENLKQSQSIIQRADRLSSLGQLTAGLAHEIRNPLVAIRTFTQLLPERYNDKEFREGFQATALKEVDRICGLVNNLLSFARPSTPKISKEDVNQIVEGISRILETEAKEKEVQTFRRLTPDLPEVFIDNEQIKQVSMNIILNAIQAIESSGVIEVSTRLISNNESEQFVQIAIRDSGPGIPEDDLENIFNPFFTTKKEGNGLGLSISNQIVKEHNGHILVKSKVGFGTTFFINLPVEQPRNQEIKPFTQALEEDSG